MKHLLLYTTLLVLFFVVFNHAQAAQNTPTKTIKHAGEKYRYEILKISDIKKVSFIINETHDDSSVIMKKNKCRLAANGGFYDTNKKPLGLIIEKGIQKNPTATGSLLNGFLQADKAGQVSIARTLINAPVYALQSGPILIEEGNALSLTIQNDEPERRVAAITSNKHVYLVVVFDADSKFLGPKLSNLPNVVTKIAKNEKIIIQSALNLDGGTASFFKNHRLFVSEFKTVGTVICVK